MALWPGRTARLLLVAAATLLSACTGNENDSSANAPAELLKLSAAGGWVGADDSGALFLTLIVDDGQRASGVLELATMSNDRTEVEPSSLSITGTASGDAATADFVLDVGSGNTWPARLERGTLTLSVRGKDGLIRDVSLTHGTADDFNDAVAELQRVADTNEAAAAAQTAQAESAAESAAAESAAAAEAQRQRETTRRQLDALAATTRSLNDTVADLDVDGDTAAAVGAMAAAAAIVDEVVDCYDADFVASDIDFARSDVAYALDDIEYYLASTGDAAAQLRVAANHVNLQPDSPEVVEALTAADAADTFVSTSREHVATAAHSADVIQADAISRLGGRCELTNR